MNVRQTLPFAMCQSDWWRNHSRAVHWPGRRKQHPPHHRIEIKLRDLDQLFNTMDPSPFHEKDLDHDAEEFIVSWVQEFHRHEPVTLVIHLGEDTDCSEAQFVAERAVHHYFAYKARLNRLEFKRLMKQARTSLFIGLAFLGACFAASEVMMQLSGPVAALAREWFIIAGWVAMWRPMEMYLYDWWPLRRRGRIYEKMSHMPVEVRPSGAIL
jgi:hypothetical protein